MSHFTFRFCAEKRWKKYFSKQIVTDWCFQIIFVYISGILWRRTFSIVFYGSHDLSLVENQFSLPISQSRCKYPLPSSVQYWSDGDVSTQQKTSFEKGRTELYLIWIVSGKAASFTSRADAKLPRLCWNFSTKFQVPTIINQLNILA